MRKDPVLSCVALREPSVVYEEGISTLKLFHFHMATAMETTGWWISRVACSFEIKMFLEQSALENLV